MCRTAPIEMALLVACSPHKLDFYPYILPCARLGLQSIKVPGCYVLPSHRHPTCHGCNSGWVDPGPTGPMRLGQLSIVRGPKCRDTVHTVSYGVPRQSISHILTYVSTYTLMATSKRRKIHAGCMSPLLFTIYIVCLAPVYSPISAISFMISFSL